jgi:hypothetical protein
MPTQTTTPCVVFPELFERPLVTVSFRQRCAERPQEGRAGASAPSFRRAGVIGGLLGRSVEIVGCRAVVTPAGWAPW